MAFLASRLGGWAIGGLAVLLMAMYVMILRGNIETLKAREELFVKNEATLTGVIDSHKSSLEIIDKQADANIKRISDYEDDQEKTESETKRLLGEINDLRATEERAALSAPYERGLAAGVRLDRIMQRFATNDGLPSGQRADGAKANDPQGTKPDDIKDPSPPNSHP